MANNIFLLRYIHAEEDFFTASFEYLLNNVPDLGQQIVEHLVGQKLSQGTGVKFQRAIDHPYFDDPKNRPDFLLKCDTCDIICEHKLNANLGEKQLERYLEVAKAQTKKTYLALVSQKSQFCVSRSMQNSKQYLKPQSRKHFVWQELCPIIAAHPHPLAQHFKQLMAKFSMIPAKPIQDWEDLFAEESEQCQAFGERLTAGLREPFKNLEAACSRDGADKWGYRIKYPAEADWLHLMYVYGRDENESPEMNWEKPTLKAAIWISEDLPQFNVFTEFKDSFQSPCYGLKISMRANNNTIKGLKARDGGTARPVATYYTDLSLILDRDEQITQAKIREFGIAVYEHLKQFVHDRLMETTQSSQPEIDRTSLSR